MALIRCILTETRDRALLVLGWLGDAAHRRMVVAAILFIFNRVVGHEIGGIDDITNIIDVILGLTVAAWSKPTPKPA